MDLDPTSEDTGGAHEGGGAPPRARPLPRGAPVAPPTYSFHPYIPTYRKNSRTEIRSGTLTGGHIHHPGTLHDEEGVVHPRGQGMYQ